MKKNNQKHRWFWDRRHEYPRWLHLRYLYPQYWYPRWRRFLWWGSAISGCALVACTMFAIIESRHLSHKVRDYIELKERVCAIKKQIAEYKQTHPTQEHEEKTLTAIKADSASNNQFLIVNRNFDHLRKSALVFARRHRMERAIAPLYLRHSVLQEEQLSHHHRLRLLRKKRFCQHKQYLHHALPAIATLEGIQQEHQCSWPLPRGSFRIGSHFGARRRPNGSWGWHYGLDLPAALGTIVKSAARGVVIEARMDPGFGNTIVIEHSNKLQTRYAHLAKIDVQTGDLVEQGQRIGRVGNTGHTRGKNGFHLHFEVTVSGNRIDPLYFLP